MNAIEILTKAVAKRVTAVGYGFLEKSLLPRSLLKKIAGFGPEVEEA